MRKYEKWDPDPIDPYIQWQNAIARRKVQNRISGPKYRAQQFGVPIIEEVDPHIVYERDNNICQICKKPVTHANRTMDHIISLDKANSEHSYKNIQTAHRSCNASKRRN